jgi:hypothetical protein
MPDRPLREMVPEMGGILRGAFPVVENEKPPELLMPVSEEHALRQFEIEALRGINGVLKDLRDDAKEDRKLLHDMHARVIRIESAACDKKIEQLEKDMDVLKADKDRREGAYNFADLARRWTPAILTILAAIGIILRATGRLGPR